MPFIDRRKNSDAELDATRQTSLDEIFLVIEEPQNKRMAEDINAKKKGMLSKFSHSIKRKGKSRNITPILSRDEKIEMSHLEIALWIDRKSRWVFPLLFASFVIFYSFSIEFEIMDMMLSYF